MQLPGAVEQGPMPRPGQALHVHIQEPHDAVITLDNTEAALGLDARGVMSLHVASTDAVLDKLPMESPQPKGLLARRRKTVMVQSSAGPGIQGPESAYKSFVQSPSFEHSASMAVGQRAGGRSMNPVAMSATMAAVRQASIAPGQQANMSEALNGAKAKALASRRGLPSDQPPPPVALPSDSMPVWKRRILTGLNHRYYYVFLCLTTLYIVFEDDIKRACLPPSWDLPLETLIAIILVCIIIEMGLSSTVKSGYLLGFYFWVDTIVCTSLFFEVPAMKQGILGIGSEPLSLEQQDAFIKWAGNRAFISSKVARVARIFRLLRLLRIYSIYKRFEGRRRIRAALAKAGIRTGEGEQHIAEEELSLIELEILQDQNKETRVGQKLEDLIIRRIIVFVLVCVLLLPAFEAEYGLWGKWHGVDRGGLAMLHDMALQDNTWMAPDRAAPATTPPSIFMTALMAFLSSVPFDLGRHQSAHVLELIIKNATLIAYPDGTRRRYDELYYMRYTSPDKAVPGCADVDLSQGCPHWITYALYDWKWFSQTAAILSISRSIFVIAFLTLGAWLLNRDSRSLVLEPIERMLARVSALADNPLALQPAARAPWQEQIEKMAEAEEQASNQQVKPGSEIRLLPRLSGLQRRKSGAQQVAEVEPAKTEQAAGQEPQPVTQPGAAARWSRLGGISMERVGAQQAGGASGANYRAWMLATNSLLAANRLKSGMAAISSSWQLVKERIKAVLRRLASNFWDGTEEDGVARPEQQDKGNEPGGASYETQLLENSIQKIGALLAVGFGDAGAEIIAENIRNEGDINPMVPGKKTVAVFGFCDIRQFTDTTEVLQEEVMEFVNSIARIVHTSVAIHGGAANKNIGDAFLLVWKLPRDFTLDDLQEACATGCPTSQLMLTDAEPQQDPAAVPVTTQNPVSSSGDDSSPRGPRAALDLTPRLDPLSQENQLSAATQLALPPALLPSHDTSAGAVAEGNEVAESHDTSAGAVAEGNEVADDGLLAELIDQIQPMSKMPSIQENQVQDVQEQIEALWPNLTRSSDSSHRFSISKLFPSRPESLSLPALPMPSLTTGQQASDTPGVAAAPEPSKPAATLSAAGPPRLSAASLKPRFLSIPDNKVVPITGDGTMARSKRVLTRGDTNDQEAIPAGADDLESLALKRVLKIRSKGNSASGKAVSAPEKAELVAAVADNALASFIIVHAALKRSVRLAWYARRPDLVARLGANTRVSMGFGLHVGWAIEGAIGSEYKIDASYLSPNVNMASRLEAATKQFGVSVLMSESFADCLSGDMRAMVRQIDCVTVKGSVQPMGLFTFDITLDAVPDADPDMPDAEEEEDAFWADYACGWCDGSQLTSIWGASPAFIAAFDKGFQAYRSGNWKEAQQLLTTASNMRTSKLGQPIPDPPSKVLLSYMEQFDFVSPPQWRGFRELTDK